MSVALVPSAESPAPLATKITWTAAATGADQAASWYRFRARRMGEDFHVIVDYGPHHTLDWTDHDHEGLFEIEASVRNLRTGEIATTSAPFQMQSRVTADGPVINPTAHEMVYLYSAPGCVTGSRMRVQFQGPDGRTLSTPLQTCAGDLSMNFYLAGMRAQADYAVTRIVDNGSLTQQGPALTLTTGPARSDLATRTVVQPPATRLPDGILLQATLWQPCEVAVELPGNC